LAAPLIVALVGIDMILLFNLEIPWHTAAHWFDVSFPRPWLVHYGDLLGSGLIALLGLIALVRRSRPGVASGLVVIGAWGIALATADLNGIDPGIQANVIDLLITGAVIVVLIARWRSLDSGMLARLGALVLFSWLVGTKGDFLQAWLGRFLPVAAVATVVIGLLWLLLTDSALATGDSKVFPMAGRPLLWVGFLLLSVTIANWILVTHALDFRSALIEKGFLHVGLPLAAWLAGTRRFVPPPEVEAEIEEAEADLAQ
jgi:hypothetical protein